jgi:LysM repeat protein
MAVQTLGSSRAKLRRLSRLETTYRCGRPTREINSERPALPAPTANRLFSEREFCDSLAIHRFANAAALRKLEPPTAMYARPLRAPLAALFALVLSSVAPGATSPQQLAALRQQAESGNSVAQHNLGLVYANPQEPGYDLVEAYVWLNLAAEKGARPRELGTVADQLTPAQLTEAQRRLAARRPSPIAVAPVITPAPLPDSAAAAADQKRLSDELAAAWKEIEQLKSAGGAELADTRKRLAIAESALATKERDLQALRTQLREASAGANVAELRQERDRLATELSTASSEAAALRSNVAELEREKQQLTEQAAARARLENELAQARKAASEATERALAHVTENRQLLTTIAELTAARDASNAGQKEIEDVRRRLTAAEAARTQAEQARVAAESQLNQLRTAQQQQASTATEAARLRQELDTARQTLAARERDLEQERNARTAAEQAAAAGNVRQTEIQELRRQLAAAEAARNQAAQALSATETQLAQLRSAQAQQSGAAADVARLGQELATLRQTLTARERELEQERNTRTAAETALAEARTAAERASAAGSSASDELIQARAQLAAARTELEAVRRQVDLQRTAATEATRLREQITALETERERLAGELASATAAGASAGQTRDDQLKQVEARLASSLRAFALQESELTRTRRQLEELTARAESTAAELAQLRPALSTAEAGAAQATAARDEIERLRGELAAATRTAEDRARELADARAAIDTAQRESTTAAQEAAMLREQMRQTLAQSASTAREAAELRTRLALSTPPPGTTRAAPSRPGAALGGAAPVGAAGADVATSLPSAPPPAATAAPAASPAAPRTHVVTHGDTLSRISQQYYGTATRWAEIFEANRDMLRAPENLRVGQTLRIP